MEIENVIRIVAIFIAVAAFALFTASRLLFPDASQAANLPVVISIGIGIAGIWSRGSRKQTKKSNNQ